MFQQTEAPSTKLPFFLGYFEDSHFACPYYQSFVPYQQGPILTSMKENGGCDVTAILGIDSTVSEQVKVTSICKPTYSNTTSEQVTLEEST